MRPGGVRLETDGFAAEAHEGLNECPVASSHIENRAGRQHPMQAAGKC
jgi:hypothetical protein